MVRWRLYCVGTVRRLPTVAFDPTEGSPEFIPLDDLSLPPDYSELLRFECEPDPTRATDVELIRFVRHPPPSTTLSPMPNWARSPLHMRPNSPELKEEEECVRQFSDSLDWTPVVCPQQSTSSPTGIVEEVLVIGGEGGRQDDLNYVVLDRSDERLRSPDCNEAIVKVWNCVIIILILFPRRHHF